METTQTLVEVLGIDPGSDEYAEVQRDLAATFERIREAERAAHIAAAQTWIA